MNPVRCILVVDDDEAFRFTLAKSFRRRGLEALEAATGEEACRLLRELQPDACVLDMKLEGASGLQVLPSLLAISPELSVVVLTGYASIATAVEAVKRGALNYLSKPVDTDEILAALGGQSVSKEEEVRDILPMSVDRLEWEHIQRVLSEHQGNISETARILGMHRRTLQRKLQKRPVKR
jgi:two-component system response regulator RegA